MESLYFKNENKIAIATLYADNYKELADLTVIQNKIPYCERHGYNLYAETKDFSLGFGFAKIKMILDLFEQHKYNWVYWCGADTLIMNQSIKLEQIIDENYHFIVAKDCHEINADSFLIKGSDEGISYMKFILDQYEKYKGDCWQEQRVMIHNQYNEPWRSYSKIVPQRTFNSYLYDLYGRSPQNEAGHFQRGDFLLHLVGLNLEKRLQLTKQYISEVIHD